MVPEYYYKVKKGVDRVQDLKCTKVIANWKLKVALNNI